MAKKEKFSKVERDLLYKMQNLHVKYIIKALEEAIEDDLELSSGFLGVVSKLLSDNDITSDTTEQEPMMDLQLKFKSMITTNKENI